MINTTLRLFRDFDGLNLGGAGRPFRALRDDDCDQSGSAIRPCTKPSEGEIAQAHLEQNPSAYAEKLQSQAKIQVCKL